jgi:hypothetical protein
LPFRQTALFDGPSHALTNSQYVYGLFRYFLFSVIANPDEGHLGPAAVHVVTTEAIFGKSGACRGDAAGLRTRSVAVTLAEITFRTFAC